MSAFRIKPKIERVADTGDRLGETPLWAADSGELSWIDIETPRMHHLDMTRKEPVTRAFDVKYLGCQALSGPSRRLIATDRQLQFLDLGSGGLQPFLSIDEEGDSRLNDGRVDRDGRLWIGTMDNGLSARTGNLYRVDPDGTVTRMLSDIIVSNGIAFSPDGGTLYFTDTRRHLSFLFDLDRDDGTISNQRLFADYTQTGERPDGACIDVDGCLWAAFFAGSRVVRYRPDGRIDRIIELPVTNPTCVCFGGPDLRTLFITTARKFMSGEALAAEPLAGALLAIEGVGQGLPENSFGLR
ncbi:MAG: SMP-30/gluconolactonase/LRE family protein [Rhizobiaceae bacterium]